MELPSSLSGLTNLKAIVAMGNDWSDLDEQVITSWKELNSFSKYCSVSSGSAEADDGSRFAFT